LLDIIFPAVILLFGTTFSHDRNCFFEGNFSFKFVPVSDNTVTAVTELNPGIFVTSIP
jgi:hypothetical protein